MDHIEITPADIIRNARKAYDEGRLQAQTRKAGEGRQGQPLTCSYVQDCAIGVSVPDKVLAQEWDTAQTPVNLLAQDGKITYPGGFLYGSADRAAVDRLQRDHDVWATEQNRSVERHSAERSFALTLSDLEREYKVVQF